MTRNLQSSFFRMQSSSRLQHSNLSLRDKIGHSPSQSSLSENLQYQRSMKEICRPVLRLHEQVKLQNSTVSEKQFGLVKGMRRIHIQVFQTSKTKTDWPFLQNHVSAGHIEELPDTSYFGLFDGEGEKGCATILRDSLHLFITRDASFPRITKEALVNGFVTAEKPFFQASIDTQDSSGSFATVLLLINGVLCRKFQHVWRWGTQTVYHVQESPAWRTFRTQ